MPAVDGDVIFYTILYRYIHYKILTYLKCILLIVS